MRKITLTGTKRPLAIILAMVLVLTSLSFVTFATEGKTTEEQQTEQQVDQPKADGETPPPTEGETPPPTEGETPPPTEGETPPPTEGETPPPTEGETPPPAEGETPPPLGEEPALQEVSGMDLQITPYVAVNGSLLTELTATINTSEDYKVYKFENFDTSKTFNINCITDNFTGNKITLNATVVESANAEFELVEPESGVESVTEDGVVTLDPEDLATVGGKSQVKLTVSKDGATDEVYFIRFQSTAKVTITANSDGEVYISDGQDRTQDNKADDSNESFKTGAEVKFDEGTPSYFVNRVGNNTYDTRIRIAIKPGTGRTIESVKLDGEKQTLTDKGDFKCIYIGEGGTAALESKNYEVVIEFGFVAPNEKPGNNKLTLETGTAGTDNGNKAVLVACDASNTDVAYEMYVWKDLTNLVFDTNANKDDKVHYKISHGNFDENGKALANTDWCTEEGCSGTLTAGEDGKVTMPDILQNRDVILFYKDNGDFAKVRVCQTNKVNYSVAGWANNDAVEIKVTTAKNESHNNKELAKDTSKTDSEYLDIDDEITITAKPDVTRIVSVVVDGKPQTLDNDTCTVTLSEAKEYTISVSFAAGLSGDAPTVLPRDNASGGNLTLDGSGTTVAGITDSDLIKLYSVTTPENADVNYEVYVVGDISKGVTFKISSLTEATAVGYKVAHTTNLKPSEAWATPTPTPVVSDASGNVTITGLEQRDVVLLYTGADTCLKVRVVQVAKVNTTVTDANTNAGISKDTATVVVPKGDCLAGSVPSKDLTNNGDRTTANGIVYDVKQKDLEGAEHPGDKLTFTVEAGAGRKVVVDVDGQTVTPDANGKFTVTTKDAKVYEVSIAFSAKTPTIVSVKAPVMDGKNLTGGDGSNVGRYTVTKGDGTDENPNIVEIVATEVLVDVESANSQQGTGRFVGAVIELDSDITAHKITTNGSDWFSLDASEQEHAVNAGGHANNAFVYWFKANRANDGGFEEDTERTIKVRSGDDTKTTIDILLDFKAFTPVVTAVTTPARATISYNDITATVSNSVTSQVIDVTVSEGATWALYSDNLCTEEITNKTMTLSVGVNTAYIAVTAANGVTNIYTLKITRSAPQAPGSPNPGSSGNSSSGSSSSGTTTVVIDGKSVVAGTTTVSGNTTNVTVNQAVLTQQIEQATDSIVISVDGTTDNASVQVGLQNIDQMAGGDMTLTVSFGGVEYSMPTSAFDTEAIMAALGIDDPSQAPITISINTELSDAAKKAVEDAVAAGGGVLVIPPMEFTITASYDGKTYEVNTFSQFVSRTVEITEEQAQTLTTAIVVEPDGTTRQVPTRVYQKDGKWYAEVNSLTNSTYAFISNKKEFADAKGKWYEKAVNEMGSRMIIAGVTEDTFEGDRSVNRAEFAAIVVRALGLSTNNSSSDFYDVNPNAWYYGAVSTASKHNIINGRGNGVFDPNSNITWQEAITMIRNAAKIAGFEGKQGDFSVYPDASQVSDWAKAQVEFYVGSGLFVHDGLLRPNDDITRGETATAVLELLQKANLVNAKL